VAYWMAQVKTAHGALSLGPVIIPPVYVQWANPNGVNVPAGGTLGPFGFDHPWSSADAEWGAFAKGGNPFTIGNWLMPVAGPLGTYTDGPVHAPYAHEQQELLDFGDAPDSALAPGYPTLLINNGARHGLGAPTLGPNPGGLKDLEFDGQPTANADGDDLNPLAADDDPRSTRLARALLGPGMEDVGIAQGRRDLDDRFADRAFPRAVGSLVVESRDRSM